MSSRSQPSRRTFLKGLGAGSALLPVLASEKAQAACDGVSGPRRVFILVWPNGMFSGMSPWATTGDNFVLSTHMKSLEQHRQDLILLDGLDYKFLPDSPNPSGGEISGHACFQGMLTGKFYQSFGSSTASNVAGGISIDQYIGNNLRQQGYTGLTSLNLQVYARSTARLSWRAAGTPVIPDFDPFHVFSTLFAGQTAVSLRRSVLDYVARDLNRFVKKVGGTEDRAAVNAHLENVRELERRLAQVSPGGGGLGAMPPPMATACRPPDQGPVLSASQVRDTKNFEVVTKLQIDLAVAAFAADATRVVVLQLGDQNNSDIILSSLGFQAGATDGNTGNVNGLLSISHRNTMEKVICDTWFMDQVAYAISRLKDVSDGAKTMLDSTVLLAMNNMRTGNGDYRGVPAILAGNCGGYFKTGRSLKLTSTPNNGVLIALANAAGVPTTTFGETIYGGELTSLRGP
ncbi:MAG: DUF1552 domain-containing protein [Pseudomonadota bacterium]